MSKRTKLANAGHVQEGRNRFAKAQPDATLFATAQEQEALGELHHALEFFPTPPWAVRAILQATGLDGCPGLSVLEPAAGRGHIVVPLREAGMIVTGRDVHDHGAGFEIQDFTVDDGPPEFQAESFDWVITNPPFSLAERFVRRGLELAPDVLVLCRLSFLCSGGRHELHAKHLRAVYPFCERVCMALGVYDPKASFATETAWFHFRRDADPLPHPAVIHIPPGQKAAHFKTQDVRI